VTMRHRLFIGIVLCALGLLFVVPQTVLAATTTFQVASVEGKSGGTVDVPIQAVGAPGLGAIHLELLYDAKVLTPDTVSRGSLSGSDALIDSNPASPGRLIIGLATLNAIKGDGPIATVRFKVVGGAGSSSTLTLDNSKAWDGSSHVEVLVKTVPGKVTITGAGSNSIWLILIIILVVVALLLLFFILRRRRRRPQQSAA